ncbi:extracellular solute-binding protein [Streptococcus alactolyticus]|uniref:Extracellular solute-binding protein n=1 Tax=Streptococcus alactolyticus TaxID=29389 RepID=A0A6N7WNL0_STRAY|nr:extracellular solute-binding protein [Streptococcus alactolyticus]MCF2665780.1 extracellular solute-binding protein [Streptococcus alactolyticus]MCF2678423.1 extracellular solute-binding protein [Streptococcus alactolyticus]MCI6904966.1 extracellular solute-binding protein [Streptococcus alactolyticus]MST53520.1 extracellular solute-binding protein [Streptococcus alactolyticus]
MKKNTWKKLFLAGAGLTLASSVLVACSNSSSSESSSSSSSDKTIKLWVPTGAKASYEEIVKKFEDESGYKVNIIESNDSKAQENVKKDPEKAADVFSLPHDQLGQLVESGVIQEIPDDYAKEISEQATEQAIAGAQYNGKTYAFPFGIESQVLFYNKSKLSADDVKNYETITTKATFGDTFKSMNAYDTAPLFMSVGDTLFGENGETVDGTNWANEAGVSVLKWIADQKNNSGFVNTTAENTMSKFGDGSVAAIETGPWDLSAAQEAVGKDNLGIAVYPKINIGGKDVQQKAFLGVKLFAVNQAPAGSDTDRIAASYKLASMLTSEESQENQFTYEGRNIIPSNKAVQKSDKVQSDELAQAVITMASSSDYTVVTPKLSQMTTFWTESAALLSDVYNGKIQSSEYLTKLQEFDADLAAAK